jgi:hypothetical protein
MNNGNSVEHLQIILNMISDNIPFGLIRPADGEYLVMIGKHLTNIDNWTFNGGLLQYDLLNIKDSIKNMDKLFVGIPCPACQGNEMYNWLKNTLEITDQQITYANIFCNKNWRTFTNYLIDNKTPLYYIGSGNKLDSPLNIRKIFNISPYLVNNWDNEKDEFIKNIDNWVNNCLINNNNEQCIFAFSAGPISKYIIPILYKKYNNCQFIDVGSTFDIFMKGNTNRSYINNNDIYSNIICDFNKGHSTYI